MAQQSALGKLKGKFPDLFSRVDAATIRVDNLRARFTANSSEVQTIELMAALSAQFSALLALSSAIQTAYPTSRSAGDVVAGYVKNWQMGNTDVKKLRGFLNDIANTGSKDEDEFIEHPDNTHTAYAAAYSSEARMYIERWVDAVRDAKLEGVKDVPKRLDMIHNGITLMKIKGMRKDFKHWRDVLEVEIRDSGQNEKHFRRTLESKAATYRAELTAALAVRDTPAIREEIRNIDEAMQVRPDGRDPKRARKTTDDNGEAQYGGTAQSSSSSSSAAAAAAAAAPAAAQPVFDTANPVYLYSLQALLEGISSLAAGHEAVLRMPRLESWGTRLEDEYTNGIPTMNPDDEWYEANGALIVARKHAYLARLGNQQPSSEITHIKVTGSVAAIWDAIRRASNDDEEHEKLEEMLTSEEEIRTLIRPHKRRSRGKRQKATMIERIQAGADVQNISVIAAEAALNEYMKSADRTAAQLENDRDPRYLGLLSKYTEARKEAARHAGIEDDDTDDA